MMSPGPLRRCGLAILLLTLVIGALVALAGRCVVLQYVRYGQYADVAFRQQKAQRPQGGCRGVILDSRGRVLAASNRIRTIFAEPRVITDPRATAMALSNAIPVSSNEAYKVITESKNPGFVRIKSEATAVEAAAVAKIRGVGVQHEWLRYYPMGQLAAHVVGFTDTEGEGLAGVEIQYNEALLGGSHQEVFLADVRRRPLRLLAAEGSLVNADLVGRGIILTIDSVIQQFAREELLVQLKEYQAESAVAVVADPKSGAILAMVSLPDFDPDRPGDSKEETWCNHAVTDQYEPGSVIKPVAVALALDAKVVNTHQKIDCEDGSYSGKGFGRISEYGGHAYGRMTVREILIESSNIGMAKIGQAMGAKTIYEGIRLFGFGRKTGVGLPGEADGYFKTLKKWDGYSVTRVPFGQEISVSSMQLIKAFCILANHGRLVRPHIVKAIVDPNGSAELLDIGCEIASQVGYIVNPEVADWIIRDAMVGAVNEGTGKPAALAKWQVFGKTGTAQIALKDGGGYEEQAYIASFIGGAPAEDPALIVLVSIRRPNYHKGYTGGRVASPVVGRIIEKALPYLQSRGLNLKESPQPRPARPAPDTPPRRRP